MQLDHRNYEETIEAELLEFTGEVSLHEVMQFAKILTADGRSMEVVVESSMAPAVRESFRAFAHASLFKPDHSERDLLSNEPSAPWLENIEILPRRRDTAWRMTGKRVVNPAAIDDIEATDIISYLNLRGVSEAVAGQGTIRIKAGKSSVFAVGVGSISQGGDDTKDVRVVRAVLDYARANWDAKCTVKGSPRFQTQAWAHAQLIGVSIPNYSLPAHQGARADNIMSEARMTYRWMTQVPSPALATRNILLRASRPSNIPLA